MVKGNKKRGAGILDTITNAVTSTYDKAKAAVTGTVQPTVDTVVEDTGLGPVATDQGAQQTLGTAPEAPGTTMTGGKKYRKTRKSKKIMKKTMRRKH
jgi:hypothetical protein